MNLKENIFAERESYMDLIKKVSSHLVSFVFFITKASKHSKTLLHLSLPIIERSASNSAFEKYLLVEFLFPDKN